MARTRNANEPPAEASTWNVLTSPWLEVMDLTGRPLKVSPHQALQDSATLHRIALANPLDVFAAHRGDDAEPDAGSEG